MSSGKVRSIRFRYTWKAAAHARDQILGMMEELKLDVSVEQYPAQQGECIGPMQLIITRLKKKTL